MKAARVVHPFPPVCENGCRALILGTMASRASREAGFYYMHPKNRFYPALSALFEEEVPLDTDGKRSFLIRHGIGLWDVVESCVITGSADASIQDPVPNDVAALVKRFAIPRVFTTGRTAYALYGKLLEADVGLPATLLPSPSPANCALPFEALCERYRAALLPALGLEGPAKSESGPARAAVLSSPR